MEESKTGLREKHNGDPNEYFKMYDGLYGNTEPEDGANYRGAGYLQSLYLLSFRNA